MGIHRVITAVVAFALLGLLPLSSAGPAGAADHTEEQAKAGAMLQARRDIAVQGLEPKPNRFFIKGKVSPAYEKKKVFILKKVGTGSYKKANKIQTDQRSKFKVRVVGPPRGVKKVCYRAMIPAGGGFKKSQSKALCITRL